MQRHLCVAILAGQMQWSGVLAVTGVGVGSVAYEQAGERCVSMQCCHVQWRETVCTAAVHSQPVRLQDAELLKMLEHTHAQN